MAVARPAFKPDASFFRKLAAGAIGAQEVCNDLQGYGHEMVDLERGATDAKLWKEMKRKRVRIPDLVCKRCGLRVESRGKTDPVIAVSHSVDHAERSWDFGLVDNDLVAFPVCRPNEEYWNGTRLSDTSSYWHERSRVNWATSNYVNYFRVGDLRAVRPTGSTRKGVTEGSETSIYWDAIFSTKEGVVDSVLDGKIKVRPVPNGRPYTWQNRKGIPVVVTEGASVRKDQVIAATVCPVNRDSIACRPFSSDYVAGLLKSREQTQRFTGVKLARLLHETRYARQARGLEHDREEDVYVRLEAAAYMVSICGDSATALFGKYLDGVDDQTQLEAVIALADAATPDSVELLSSLLGSGDRPFYLRSAAAWSLSQIGGDKASRGLVQAFSDVDPSIREEALQGIRRIGEEALPPLLAGLSEGDDDVAAGCAESLRQRGSLPEGILEELTSQVSSTSDPRWTVWLLGHLPRSCVSDTIVGLEESRPELYYAISVLWSFVESWIARHWELDP